MMSLEYSNLVRIFVRRIYQPKTGMNLMRPSPAEIHTFFSSKILYFIFFPKFKNFWVTLEKNRHISPSKQGKYGASVGTGKLRGSQFLGSSDGLQLGLVYLEKTAQIIAKS